MTIQVLFHVGPHKTGTTTLQYAFDSLREELRDQGIYYPQGLHGSGAHHVLAWQFLERPLGFLGFDSQLVPPAASRLMDWVGEAESLGCSTLLLSAEDFSLLTEEQWNSALVPLRSTPKVSSIRAICVSRSPVAMARSAYGTLVMFGENRRFEDLEVILSNRFERVLTKIEDLTGRNGIFDGRIEVKFESLARAGRLVETFCNQVLCASISRRDWPSLNVSLPNEILEAVRVWNTLNCHGVTIEEDSGDFSREVFELDPAINQRRIAYAESLLQERADPASS